MLLRLGNVAGALALALMAVGCASGPRPEPVVKTITVSVPTPISCVPADISAAPSFGDTKDALLAARGADERYQLLAANWAAKAERLALLEGVVANCKTAIQPK